MKTYKSLIAEARDALPHSNQFLNAHKMDLLELSLNDEQYNVFWNCMKIYNYTGDDYFTPYYMLLTHKYGDYTNTPDVWAESLGLPLNLWQQNKQSQWCDAYCENLRDMINALIFFEIDDYDGKSIGEYQEMQAKTVSHFAQARENIILKYESQKQQTFERRINNYFNFGDFSESKCKQLFLQCIRQFDKNEPLSINEALERAVAAPKDTYAVVFGSNGVVCAAGKTNDPLSYIGQRHKRFNADSATFEKVDDDYVDDVLISILVHYDLPIKVARVTPNTRQYATLKQAYFSYKKRDGIRKKEIDTLRERGMIREVDIDADNSLINKIELERLLLGDRRK